jgi:hypothetical protein
MAEALDKCCLCLIDVSEGTFFTKRRKIMGAAAANAVKIIDELSVKNFRKKFSLAVDKSSVICHKCKSKAEELPNLIKKAENARENLTELVRKVVRCDQVQHTMITAEEEVVLNDDDGDDDDDDDDACTCTPAKVPRQSHDDANDTVHVRFIIF